MQQVVSASASAARIAEVFAGNRATGKIALAVAANSVRTWCASVYETGSLRVRFPKVACDPLEAVFINTAGGIAGGDELSLNISLGRGASLIAGNAAAEKIYRTLGPEASISLTIDAASRSRCLWLPQETILFDRASLARRINIDLADDASLVVAESVVFGRSAMGEIVNAGSLIDRWRVRRAGQLIFAENLRLDGEIGAKLAEPVVAAGAAAIATVLVVPGDEAKIAAVRARSAEMPGEIGISCWNGITLMRLCARDGAAIRHSLTALLPLLGASLPRLWTQ